jgi:para-aminobenzoate synthetase component 1
MASEIEVKVRPLALQASPREAMGRLRGGGRYALLESALAVAGKSDWSYIAGPAVATLYTDAGGTRLERAGRVDTVWDDPFTAIEALCPSRPPRLACHGDLPPGLDLIGGWVGVLGYDIARRQHPLPSLARDDAGLPGMWWMAVDQVLAFHHPSGRWWHCTARGGEPRAWPWSTAGREADWDATLARAATPRASRGVWRAGPLRPQMGRARFEAGVRSIRATIAAGGCMQVNLTRRVDAAFGGDPWALYEALASAHPAPCAAYVEGPSFALASCSPERFLRLRDRTVQARPIKGTAARGTTPAEDIALRDWLVASAKNRAENLMIVDLMRNDLGRVAEVGSVRVPELFALEPYASVWQLVSTVEARLRDGSGIADLLRACWPPGSMTGAPKLAAMQAIEGLEPTRRGLYAGSAGYLDCRGNADLSVIIRSAVVVPGRVSVQLGGGIVADSDPASEWLETVAKGRHLLAVLARDAGTEA